MSALAVSAVVVQSAPAASAAPAPPNSKTMFKNLAKLPSYHIDSQIKYSGTGTKAGMITFTEDVHGKDYRLTFSTNTSSGAAGTYYYVKGHLYISASGQMVDVGSQGAAEAASLSQGTIGYWSDLAQNQSNVHYLGRTSVNGRSADKFTAVWDAGAVASAAGAHSNYQVTIYVDATTGAMLKADGSWKASYKGKSYNLTTSWLLSKIGQVGPISVPGH